MRTATTKDSILHGDGHTISCCICGERDFDKMHIHNLGLAVGMCGDDYSFCFKCWMSPTLGNKILRMLGFKPKTGMKLKDESLDISGEV
jgi:hypothetical protein